MSFIGETRREANHTTKQYGSVGNLFSIFFPRVYLKSTCCHSLQFMALNALK